MYIIRFPDAGTYNKDIGHEVDLREGATRYADLATAQFVLEQVCDGEIVEITEADSDSSDVVDTTPIVWTVTDRVHYAQHEGIRLRLTPHAMGGGYTAAAFREHWLCEQEFASLQFAKKSAESFARRKWTP